MDKRVYIEESGCNRRKLDVGKIRSFFLANGYELVSNPKSASYIIVTTCAFKRSEEEASIVRVRHYVNSYPAKVIVYGCLPSIAPEKYKEFEHIQNFAPKEIERIDSLFHDITVSFSEIVEENLIHNDTNWVNSIKRKMVTGEAFTRDFVQQAQSMMQQRLKGLAHAEEAPYYLFICRGCLGKCSYCAIRRSVGHVRSKTRRHIVQEFVHGLAEGHRSFVLLGDDPGCYGLDIGTSLPELVQDILKSRDMFVAEGGGDVQLAINEIHPKFLIHYRSELTELLRDASFKTVLCPVQSGNDRILTAMQREHLVEPLRDSLQEIRKQNPAISFDTQIMVGFPTETDEEFDQTLHYVADLGFNSVVVFPYDDKEGTDSMVMYPKTPPEIIKQRTRHAFKFFKEANIQAYYNCP